MAKRKSRQDATKAQEGRGIPKRRKKKAKVRNTEETDLVAPLTSSTDSNAETGICARRTKRKRRLREPKISEEVDRLHQIRAPALSAAPRKADEAVGSKVAGVICEAAKPLSLEAWLCQGGANLDALEIRSKEGGIASDRAVFARRDLAAGDVACVVPASLMLTAKVAVRDTVVAAIRDLLQSFGEEDSSPTFLLCLRLCRARLCPEDPFHSYVSSLADSSPGAASWPAAFLDMLFSTALCSALEAADTELDRWHSVLDRAAKAQPLLLSPEELFERTRLKWARGMLNAQQLHDGPGGAVGEQSPCMIPLLDLLMNGSSGNVTVRHRADVVEFTCDRAVKAGEQILHACSSKANAELLMHHGFALSDNPFDSVPLPLAPTDGTGACSRPVIRLSAGGIPEEEVEAIEANQDTARFVALLRATLTQRRTAKECLARLPVALNFTVCKGPLARYRKRSIEVFLEGQINILETCLEEMQSVDPQAVGADDASDSEECAEEDIEEEEEEYVPRKKKRRRRR